ncbi:MAG: NlpC/P60 family protein [Sedimentitalea sp.]
MNDPRETFANGSVAHVSLKGTIQAQRFSQGTLMRVTVPVANIHRRPGATALERQLLMGAPFRVLETANTCSFGRAENSGYVGYVNPDMLGAWQTPTHRVTARTTLLFAAPNMKHPNPTPLPMGAELTITSQESGFCRTAQGHFIPIAHLSLLSQTATDPVTVAETLLAAPYLWGGNSAYGIDCSGLVQFALTQCGLPCPGDSDQQCRALGTALSANEAPKRGDLMFWKGHVAWLADAETLLHANAHHMAVAYEPLATALPRIAAQGTPLLAHKRL